MYINISKTKYINRNTQIHEYRRICFHFYYGGTGGFGQERWKRDLDGGERTRVLNKCKCVGGEVPCPYALDHLYSQ